MKIGASFLLPFLYNDIQYTIAGMQRTGQPMLGK